MRNTIIGVSVLALMVLPTTALAWGNYSHHYQHGHRKVSSTPTPTPVPPVPPVVVPPAPTPVPPPPITPPLTPPSNEQRFTAYVTGYGYPDNTPAGSAISHPVIHQSAGGIGTYADPVTLAVGHSITNGRDDLDYPAGTRFYAPFLHRYFIVEDTCGDGSSPQSGPCHTGYQGNTWLDFWVGGNSAQRTATLNCEDAITGLHAVILNPASNYAVVSGPVFNGSCSAQYGDTVVSL